MVSYLKIASVRSSCSPRAPHKDKPKDFLQEDGRSDTIVGRGHSDETVGVEYGPRRFCDLACPAQLFGPGGRRPLRTFGNIRDSVSIRNPGQTLLDKLKEAADG